MIRNLDYLGVKSRKYKNKMPDLLFEQFASPENLKQAFVYVQTEVKKTTLPLDPFWVPGIKAIETLGDAFFNSLSKLLSDGRYRPDPVYFFHQHKENFSVRRIAMITIVDRVVYQALFNKPILGTQLAQNTSKLSCYPGLSNEDEIYLEDYKPCYQSYWDRQESDYLWSEKVNRGEYDVSAFFDNISHQILFKMMADKKIGSDRVVKLFKTLLTTWFSDGKGIPQGSDVSSAVANFYLSPVDDLFASHSPKVSYVRYMDDMSFLAESKKDLLSCVEKLTMELDKLGLNLNSKTRFEVIEDVSYFEDKGKFATYQSDEEEEDLPFFEKARNEAPQIIQDLTFGNDVNKQQLSKLKYYLKADKDYVLCGNILELFAQLPSFAAPISRYIEPIAGLESIQKIILEQWRSNHLFRWQKLWLAKIILIQKMNHQGFQNITFKSHKNWELRAMNFLVDEMVSDTSLEANEFSALVQNAEHIFELGIYASLISKISPSAEFEQIKNNLCTNCSLEIQTITLAQILDQTTIEQIAKDGSLFYSQAHLPSGGHSVSLISDSVTSILGFSAATHPRKRYVFQLILEGDEILMVGSILNGWSTRALPNKGSGYYRLLKTMLCLHESYAPNKYHVYTQEIIENGHISPQGAEEVGTIDVVKDKRFLHPLCKHLIDQLLKAGTYKGLRKIEFRSAIDEECFSRYSINFQTEIARLADQVINPVN